MYSLHCQGFPVDSSAPARHDSAMAQRFETFIPSIEFAENPNNNDFYWQPWPLDAAIRLDAAGHAKPLAPEAISAQLDACSARHPYAFVRLNGYCPQKRNTALSFVAKTPLEGQVI